MEAVLDQMRQDLARAEYAESTRSAYVRTITGFIEEFRRPVEELGREQVREFVAKLEVQGKSASWMKMIHPITRPRGPPRLVGQRGLPRT